MIDTNTITAAAQTVGAIKDQVTAFWPTLVIVGAFVGREIRNFNQACYTIAEWIIRHGGVAMILKKLIWNPAGNPLAGGINKP